MVGVDISAHMLPAEGMLPHNTDLQVDDLNTTYVTTLLSYCIDTRVLTAWVLRNCRFEFPSDHFDLVHSQMMAGGINANRWRGYLGDIFRVLRPGGWCQMVELYLNAQSDNGSLEQGQIIF